METAFHRTRIIRRSRIGSVQIQRNRISITLRSKKESADTLGRKKVKTYFSSYVESYIGGLTRTPRETLGTESLCGESTPHIIISVTRHPVLLFPPSCTPHTYRALHNHLPPSRLTFPYAHRYPAIIVVALPGCWLCAQLRAPR